MNNTPSKCPTCGRFVTEDIGANSGLYLPVYPDGTEAKNLDEPGVVLSLFCGDKCAPPTRHDDAIADARERSQ